MTSSFRPEIKYTEQENKQYSRGLGLILYKCKWYFSYIRVEIATLTTKHFGQLVGNWQNGINIVPNGPYHPGKDSPKDIECQDSTTNHQQSYPLQQRPTDVFDLEFNSTFCSRYLLSRYLLSRYLLNFSLNQITDFLGISYQPNKNLR